MNLRKCFDAINFGSMKAKQPLPKSFYDELNAFLDSFNVETKDAKKLAVRQKGGRSDDVSFVQSNPVVGHEMG